MGSLENRQQMQQLYQNRFNQVVFVNDASATPAANTHAPAEKAVNLQNGFTKSDGFANQDCQLYYPGQFIMYA